MALGAWASLARLDKLKLIPLWAAGLYGCMTPTWLVA